MIQLAQIDHLIPTLRTNQIRFRYTRRARYAGGFKKIEDVLEVSHSQRILVNVNWALVLLGRRQTYQDSYTCSRIHTLF